MKSLQNCCRPRESDCRNQDQSAERTYASQIPLHIQLLTTFLRYHYLPQLNSMFKRKLRLHKLH